MIKSTLKISCKQQSNLGGAGMNRSIINHLVEKLAGNKDGSTVIYQIVKSFYLFYNQK